MPQCWAFAMGVPLDHMADWEYRVKDLDRINARAYRPETRIVAGGYDPSLAPETYEPCAPIEFLVRGEGEFTFQALLAALESGGAVEAIAGLSYRAGGTFVHNPTPAPARRSSGGDRSGRPAPERGDSSPGGADRL